MEKIDQIYYINLEHRTDRREHIENEIKKIDSDLEKTTRIEAIKHEQGGIGCGMSHIKVLEDAIEKNYQNIIVLEDDFKFTVETNIFFEYLQELYNYDKEYNICMLSRYIISHNKLNDKISEVIFGKTTSGMLINGRFFKTLKDNFSESIGELLKGNQNINNGYAGNNKFAIDENWKKLQGIGKKFYTFNIPLGIQIGSFSDIEKRNTNYLRFLNKII